jgi:hypothetical protein
MYTHVIKCKMIPIETIPGMGRRDEREQWNCDIFDTL